jgi:hypothetical protein
MVSDVQSREEQIDRWVVRNALALALQNVCDVCEVEGGSEDVENIAAELNADLFDQLWPDNAEPGPVADARSAALASSILVRLATDEARNFLLEESGRLAALAEEHLRAVSDDAS